MLDDDGRLLLVDEPGSFGNELLRVLLEPRERVYVQEVDREDAGGLGCQELAPCWPGPARR
jgi:hypothetical protein